MNRTEKLDLVLRTMTPPGDWKEAQEAMKLALKKKRREGISRKSFKQWT